MPNSFCSLCGSTHEADNIEACEALRGEGKTATRASSRRTTVKMSKQLVKEELAEVPADHGSLVDRKKEIEQAIEELRLEEEVAALEEEMQRLMARREKRATTEAARDQTGGVAAAIAMPAPKDDAGTLPTDDKALVPRAGYSAYGRSRQRSRHRSREMKKKRSSSSSSTSRSESRRRRRKWALKRYTLNKKDVEKLNCYELICATALWVVDVAEVSVKDCKAVFEHINFLGNRAMYNDFYDSAHINYDNAVRKLAETEGFSAFAQGSNGASVIHYGNQNMRGGKSSNTFKQKRPSGQQGKRACYAWNGEQGCARSEEECRFAHICSRCALRGHKRSKCRE